MIGTVKRHLVRSVGKAHLTFEELTTVLVEIEATVNSRPLVNISSDPEDQVILTPAHLISDEPAASLPAIEDAPSPVRKEEFRRRWLYRKRVLSSFWRMWRNEYLLQLRGAHLLRNPNKNEELRINEVVLVKDEKSPRLQWRMAVVQLLIPGRDGKTRTVVLRLSDGTVLRRAVQHVCPLEVHEE
jgi:hypothetical protein